MTAKEHQAILRLNRALMALPDTLTIVVWEPDGSMRVAKVSDVKAAKDDLTLVPGERLAHRCHTYG